MSGNVANKRKSHPHRMGQALVLMAALVVLLAGLKVAQGFFTPVLMAFFVATASIPVTNWLQQRRIPRALAVIMTVLVDFAFLTGLVFLVVTAVGDFQSKWNSEYSALSMQKLKSAVNSIGETEARMREWWNAGPFEVPKILLPEETDMPDAAEPAAGDAQKAGVAAEDHDAVEDVRVSHAAEVVLGQLQELKFAQVWNLGTGVLGHVLSFLGTALVVIILTVFMLTEARMFSRRMDLVTEARGPDLQNIISALRDTQRYLGIKTLISLATGVLAAVLCWAAGLDFWPLWGILAFGLNFIPVVGSIIAAVPPTLLALLISGTPNAIVIALGYFLINTFLGNFLEPMLMGKRFGLSTLVVLLSVLFWGWLWGPMGAFLAIPLTMVIKVILDNSTDFRWVSVAIGAEVKQPPGELPMLSGGERLLEKEGQGQTELPGGRDVRV